MSRVRNGRRGKIERQKRALDRWEECAKTKRYSKARGSLSDEQVTAAKMQAEILRDKLAKAGVVL